MKNLIHLITLFSVVIIISCNKEPLVTPSADFSTNITNNTLEVKEPFVLYLDNVQGDYVTYFKGDYEKNTYSPDNPRAEGTFIQDNDELDSVNVTGYANPGEYIFTVVAASSGNWGEDYEKTSKSITIKVVEGE